jgi:pyrophosphatase PpaX
LPGVKQYACYLFDADGTLIDTIELIYRCFEHSLRTYAKRPIARPEVVANVGLTLRRQFEMYLGPLNEEQYRCVRDIHMNYQLAVYPRYLRAFPGVKEGLDELKERGKRCAVVTSRLRQTLTVYLQSTGLLDYFEILITPEDTEKHKPDPQPVLAALERLHVRAQDALFVGDASWDIECGAAAGVDTAFVLWSHSQPSALRVQPTHLLSSVMDLCKE